MYTEPRKRWALIIGVLVVTLLTPTADLAAQMPLAYPEKGQLPEQQRRDEFECHQWATDRSGYDPRPGAPRPYYGDVPAPRSGGGLMDFGGGAGQPGDLVGDAARGAALGAVGGAIAGDAGEGAAWGALGGTIFGGLLRQSRVQQEAEWERRHRARLEDDYHRMQQGYVRDSRRYNDAFGLCMESRGYRVRY